MEPGHWQQDHGGWLQGRKQEEKRKGVPTSGDDELLQTLVRL